jgi:hypothetical protein
MEKTKFMFKKYLMIFLVSMVPIVELRGAIPISQGFQLPRYGIYITRTRIGDRWYPSATGLGTRPTVNSDESKVTCETFIPGFTGDLYGTDPVVEFHAYLSQCGDPIGRYAG